MSIDASKPLDTDLISTYAGLIREARAAVNTNEAAIAAALLPGLSTIANADTSPSVTGGFAFKTANAGATTVTFFDNGYEGQVIAVIAGDGYTTIQHDAGLIFLTSQANVKLLDGEAMLFALEGDVWHEVGGYKRTSMKTVTAAAYSILTTDVALRCNAGSNAITNTLPLAASVSMGHTIRVKKTDSVEANVVSTVRQGSDTINEGTAALELTLQNESFSFVSDGVSDWTTFN